MSFIDDTEAIRLASSARDLAAEAGYVTRKRGEWWQGRCADPGHNDKHPSAGYSDKGFRCQGCGASGDVFALYRLLHSCTFGEAKDALRLKAGLPLPSVTIAKMDIGDSFEAWCAHRSLRPSVLRDVWRAKPAFHMQRPGFWFPTALGRDRFRFIDGGEPKVIWGPGSGTAALYGISGALALLKPAKRLYVVNGEPSVWAAQQSGVPAVCTGAGESSKISDADVAALRDSGGKVVVAYDRDKAGRNGSKALVRHLRGFGVDAMAIELPEMLGKGGDVDDLHRRTGDAGLAQALDAIEDAIDPSEPDFWFTNGSDEEIAQHVLEGLRKVGKDTLPPLRFDQGLLWRYQPAAGVWVRVHEVEVRNKVGSLDRTHYMDRGNFRRLKMSHSQRKAATATALDLSHAPGFFEGATRGAAFTDGFVAVRGKTIGVEEHNHEHRARFALPFALDEDTGCPRWLQALGEWLAPTEDPQGCARVLQEFVGAALCGLAPDFQRSLILTGEGRNGKSVFLDVVSALFPPGTRCAVPPQKMSEDFARAELVGARINVVSEVPEQGIFDSGGFKTIVAGEQIGACRKFGHPFIFAPEAAHLFSTNALPSTTDHSDGFYRRWLIVPFLARFEGAAQVTRLQDQIIATELPGIARWAIDGAVRLLERNGYELPADHLAALGEWRRTIDSVADWLHERTETIHGGETGASVLFSDYEDFCQRTRRKVPTMATFGTRLGSLGVDKRRTKHGMQYKVTLKPRLWVVGGEG